jgi:hypothetical protein
MALAGIPRVGPTGEKRTFHSLRHTLARFAIENNRPIFWLSKPLPVWPGPFSCLSSAFMT